MIGRSVLAAIAAGLAATGTAYGEDGTSTACELHVWPAAAMRFSNQGMWDNFKSGVTSGLLGAWDTPERGLVYSKRDGTDALPDSPDELMGMAEQVQLLTSIPDGSALGLPNYRIVVHDSALTSRDIRNTPGRYAPESAACYADLVLDSLFFSNEWGNGQNLKSFYRFRDFGTGDVAVRSFGAWVDTRLAIEPEDLPEKFDQARAEIRAAFTGNVARFGEALAKNATRTITKQGEKK